MDISVEGYRLQHDCVGMLFAEFQIRVSAPPCQGSRCKPWTVHRRFSEFTLLRAQLLLSTSPHDSPNLPELPPKNLWKTNTDVLATRSAMLEAFLRQLMRRPEVMTRAVARFLDAPAHMPSWLLKAKKRVLQSAMDGDREEAAKLLRQVRLLEALVEKDTSLESLMLDMAMPKQPDQQPVEQAAGLTRAPSLDQLYSMWDTTAATAGVVEQAEWDRGEVPLAGVTRVLSLDALDDVVGQGPGRASGKYSEQQAGVKIG